MKISVHQESAGGFARLDADGTQREVERGARHLPEILVLIQQSAQPAVFELFQPPQLGDHLALPRIRLFGLRQHRLGIVEGSVSVEYQRPDCHFAAAHQPGVGSGRGI
jgi:hypothetical protein